MTRLVLLTATALLVAAPAFAQQSRLVQQPQNRFLAQPGTGLAGRQQQLQFAPRPGAGVIARDGAGLISNNRGGVLSDNGLGFRR